MKNYRSEYILPIVKTNLYVLRLIKAMKIIKCILILFSIGFTVLQTACLIKNK